MMRLSIPATRLASTTNGLGCIAAGLGGGLAMAVVAALISISRGTDIWLEAKQIAVIVYGQQALTQPELAVQAVATGTLFHLIVAGLLGLLFGFLSHQMGLPSDFGIPLLTGFIFGMLVWMIAYFIVLPAVNPALLDTYLPAYIIQHIVFGMVTGLLYAWLCPHPYHSSSTESWSETRIR